MTEGLKVYSGTQGYWKVWEQRREKASMSGQVQAGQGHLNPKPHTVLVSPEASGDLENHANFQKPCLVS